jgi:hypothetical protein
MRSLSRMLQDHDRGQLKIIAEFWGLAVSADPVPIAAEHLAAEMLDSQLLGEICAALPPGAAGAWRALQVAGGRLTLADLERRFGALPSIGPARRDRQKTWRAATGLDALWYRGLLGRAFSETPGGMQEIAYIPDDVLALLPPAAPDQPGLQPMAQPPAYPSRSGTKGLEDAATLLAALRRKPLDGPALETKRAAALRAFMHNPGSLPMLLALLHEQSLIHGPPFTPDPEAVRRLLDLPAGAAQLRLLKAWAGSSAWNDLSLVDGLRPAGHEWPNDPRHGRQAVLKLLEQLTAQVWWKIEPFVQSVRESQPGFQRPAGDFDSWYLQDSRSGAPLRGYRSWDAVDGSYLRQMLAGPLYWLGAVDLGSDETEAPARAFRLTPLFERRGGLQPGDAAPQPTGAKVQLHADGRLAIPPGVPAGLRYQLARLSAWEGLDGQGYHYRLTPASLAQAAEQGLQPEFVLSLLETASERPLPANLQRAIARLKEHGVEARIDTRTVLQVADSTVLDKLFADQHTARFLETRLGDNAALIGGDNWRPLCQAAARLGLLIEPPPGRV